MHYNEVMEHLCDNNATVVFSRDKGVPTIQVRYTVNIHGEMVEVSGVGRELGGVYLKMHEYVKEEQKRRVFKQTRIRKGG